MIVDHKIKFLIEVIQQKGQFAGNYEYCEGVESSDKHNFIIIFRRDQMTQGMMLLFLKNVARFSMVPDVYIRDSKRVFDDRGWTDMGMPRCIEMIDSFFEQDCQFTLLATSSEKILYENRIQSLREDHQRYYSRYIQANLIM